MGHPDANACNAPDIITHMPLVRKIARQVHSRLNAHVELEELEQHGMVALVEAQRSYQDIGLGFTGYAAMRVRGAMIDHLRRTAHISRGSMAMQKRVRAAVANLEQLLARHPSSHEIATAIGVDAMALARHQQTAQGAMPTRIDDHYGDSDARFADPAPNAEARLVEQSTHLALKAAVSNLAEREAQVLRGYFIDELPLAEIARKLGIGAARVCQIKQAACRKLRSLLAAMD